MGSDKLLGSALEGRFQLDERIRVREIASSYRGIDTSTDDAVIVQVITVNNFSELELEEFLGSLQGEVEKTQVLDDPHVMPILHFGSQGDLAYLVMPHLSGRTLAEELGQGRRFSVAETQQIIAQTASGLEAAHKVDLVHGDLTPESIYLEATDESSFVVRLMDFAFVKLAGSQKDLSARLTQHGDTLGVPEYISPEQVQNLPCSPASDQYSLGIVAYELLAGRPPFVGPSQALAVAAG